METWLADVKGYVQTGCACSGPGHLGSVIKAVHITSVPPRVVAIKLLPRGDLVRTNRLAIQRQIKDYVALYHPFFIRLRELFLTPSHLAIVMEYADGRDLEILIRKEGRLIEQMARWIFQQLIIALDFSHHVGVGMRDLRLENILLDRMGRNTIRPIVKICDFSYIKRETSLEATLGDLTLGDPASSAAKEADTWSCGVILYRMLYGKVPSFAAELTAADYKVLQDVQLSAECRDILKRLLTPNSAERICIEDIKRHAWYLKDLPDGALEMNDFYVTAVSQMRLQECNAGIDSIVDQAQDCEALSAAGIQHCTISRI
ncbi:hypothetical protein WJX75_004738 [Coccomyxa subellipsoidea]|uniref:Protein kinase domain-containing protein n=1 Tax=Coccomyxa subellipsoidea TaxID=248742 RepID=A0ABR2YRW1_9CHLO